MALVGMLGLASLGGAVEVVLCTAASFVDCLPAQDITPSICSKSKKKKEKKKFPSYRG